MAEIRRFLWMRHLRSENSMQALRFRKGRLVASGRGMAFWFYPMSTSVAEVPLDDRELTFLFHGRSSDFQDVAVQGVATWRILDPERAAARLDFSLDLGKGTWLKTPIEQLESVLTGMARQAASRHLAERPVQQLLTEPLDAVQTRIAEGILGAETLTEMGIGVVAVRVSAITPTAELEKALMTPERERIQQTADEATFNRRAMAVEKERAIAENELKNKIELARREAQLIEQKGTNERRRVEEDAAAKAIDVEAKARRTAIEAEAQAGHIRLVEGAKNEAEAQRLDVFRGLPTSVILGMAAQELAGKLNKIEHLNLSPEMFGPLVQRLMQAGADRLEAPK
ncbi:MAG: band 7 protein [Myxococcales bacterium]|nr:band 7 protein [Myxococcales bacterium]MCB9549581.1 band 7 protein [Myxococcales bacterium]